MLDAFLLRRSLYTLDCLIGCNTRKQKKTVRNEKTRRQWCFFRGETQTLNFYRGLEYARSKKFVIFFNNQCNPIEICIYARKKHLFTSYPAAKHLKKWQICYYTHARKTSRPCWLYGTGIGFSSSNNFANLGSFAKVTVPVEPIIPCSTLTLNWSYLINEKTTVNMNQVCLFIYILCI